MKVLELIIDKLDELTGVDAVALVEQPAIQADFFAFSEKEVEDAIALSLIRLAVEEHNIAEEVKLSEKQEFKGIDDKMMFAFSEEQQMVVGPLMIPNKLIFRIDENGDPYYVYFSEETVRTIAEKMMKNKFTDKVNLEHSPDQPVDSYMVSTWLVEDVEKDKQQVYGMSHPVGTLMAQYKIEDPEVWKKVKAGEIKGFSVEGFFGDRFVQAKQDNI